MKNSNEEGGSKNLESSNEFSRKIFPVAIGLLAPFVAAIILIDANESPQSYEELTGLLTLLAKFFFNHFFQLLLTAWVVGFVAIVPLAFKKFFQLENKEWEVVEEILKIE